MAKTDQIKGTNVTLNSSELYVAANVGLRRALESMKKGLSNRHGLKDPSPWTLDIEGAVAEAAAAKALNVFWSGPVNNFKGGDVGEIQVRSSAGETNSLIVRPSDSDDAIFVLAIGKTPTFRIVGWMSGKDAKNRKWMKSPAGRPVAFFVPQEDLKDLASLEKLLHKT